MLSAVSAHCGVNFPLFRTAQIFAPLSRQRSLKYCTFQLNPIENLWSSLDEKVPLARRHTKEEFLNELQAAFDLVDETYMQHLVESLPRRLKAVIHAKGGNTKY